MNKIPNRQAICDVLMERAKTDKDIVVLCSDSRGSASLAPFAEAYPEQFVEVGIAEQDLVSISAGLAKCGKKPFAASPASFLSTRSYEQAKVDVAYSNTNVTLIGISGGISYGALGMSHHSAQDIAAMSAIPNMRVYLPSDRFQTAKLIDALLKDEKPSYIRVGRNAVEDIYSEESCPFEMDQATVICGETVQTSRDADFSNIDLAIVACGEMVKPACDAAVLLKEQGICAAVLDMYCVKPLDTEAIIRAAKNAKAVLTVEEHAPFGGLGSMVSQVVGSECPKRTVNLALPDAPVITGTSKEVFDYYGLNAEGIAKKAAELLQNCR
ncbi:MAG: transketolase family protein [Clostridiales bacterium]|nr:transketolase family protein [Clostridiales bacterium]